MCLFLFLPVDYILIIYLFLCSKLCCLLSDFPFYYVFFLSIYAVTAAAAVVVGSMRSIRWTIMILSVVLFFCRTTATATSITIHLNHTKVRHTHQTVRFHCKWWREKKWSVHVLGVIFIVHEISFNRDKFQSENNRFSTLVRMCCEWQIEKEWTWLE